MCTMTLKNFSRIGKGSFIALFIACLLFALSSRVSSMLTYEQYCLSVLTDHYYLIYLVIPLFLFICFSVIEDDSEIVIIRYGTYFRYFLSKWVSLVAVVIVFMLMQLSVVVVSGIGLPLGNSWTLREGLPVGELFGVLELTFSSPLSCLIITIIYTFFGLCVTGMICLWLGHFLSKSLCLKVLIALYVITMCSIKISFLYRLPLTLFNHLIILHHNLTGKYRFSITIITVAVLLVTILLTTKKHWNVGGISQIPVPKGLTLYYCKTLISPRNMLIIGTATLLMIILKHLKHGGGITAEEWIGSFFAGHGVGMLRVFNFLEMLITNGLPLYLLAMFIERITSSHSDFITIRLKKRVKMLSAIINTAILFILLYGLCIVLILTVVMTAFGFSISNETFTLLLSATSIKLLDIGMQFLLMTVLYCLTRQVTTGFVVLVGLNLLCVLPEKLIRYLPFGLSSLSRLNLYNQESGVPFILACSVLIAFGGLIIIWLRLWGYKKILKN